MNEEKIDYTGFVEALNDYGSLEREFGSKLATRELIGIVESDREKVRLAKVKVFSLVHKLIDKST